MAKVPRISRLIEILVLLHSDAGWTGAALAERFGISRTRIFNDVRLLKAAGVPVRRTASGYRIEASFFLPTVEWTPQEALALLFPGELYRGVVPNDEVRRSAREKLLLCLPPEVRAQAEDLMRHTDVALPTAGPDGEIMTQLRDALVDRRRIAIIYTGRTSDALRRLEVDPYGLAFRKHAWYLVAWSAAHREVRKFRASRIQAIEPTPLHFTVPEGFSLHDFFDGSWYVFGGKPQEIAVRFGPRVARLIRERVPHPGQQIQTLSDGTLIYRATVRNLDEVAWWLVQYGGDAAVVYPGELRNKVIDLAVGILGAYGMTVAGRRRAYPTAGEATADHVAEAGPGPPATGKS